MSKLVPVLAVLGVLTFPIVAQADTGSVTIEHARGDQYFAIMHVQHDCGIREQLNIQTCFWFAEAGEYSASAGCPVEWEPAGGFWVGHVKEGAGEEEWDESFIRTEMGAFVVCLYVQEGLSELVGQTRYPRLQSPGAEALPTRHEKCGHLRAHGYTYLVLIRRGYQSCASSRHAMARFLSGHGTEHGGRSAPDSAKYWTLSGGWRCKQGTGGANCIRGGPPNYSRAYEWIEADN